MSAEPSAQQRQYREVYLRSDHWRQMRALALEDAEHRCAICNSRKELDVHHRTYERLGEERLNDLLVMCRKCHDLFHRHRHVMTPAQKRSPDAVKKRPTKAGRRRKAKAARAANQFKSKPLRIALAAAAPPAPPPQRLQHEPLPPRPSQDWREERQLPRKGAA